MLIFLINNLYLKCFKFLSSFFSFLSMCLCMYVAIYYIYKRTHNKLLRNLKINETVIYTYIIFTIMRVIYFQIMNKDGDRL